MRFVGRAAGTIALFVAAIFSSQPPIHAQPPQGEQSYEYVSKVQVGDDNYLYINVRGNFSSVHGCNQPWFARSKYPITDERTKAEERIALASFLSRKQVYIWTVACTGYGYPIMVGIQMFQD